MKIGMSERMYDRGTIEESIRDAAKIGYDGIELRPLPNHLPADTSPSRLAEIKKLLADYGLEVPCIACMPTSYLDKSDEECNKQLDEMKVFIGFAQELGCSVLRHWIGAKPSRDATEADWECAAEWMRKGADIAAGEGITLALELHHGTLIDTVDGALEFLNRVRKDNVSIIHDAANLYQDNVEYGREAIEKLKDKLQEIHAKDIVEVVDDCNPRAGGLYRGRRFVDRMIEQGGVDQYSIFTGLKNMGFDGYAVVESGLVSGLDSFGVAEGCYNAIREIMAALDMK